MAELTSLSDMTDEQLQALVAQGSAAGAGQQEQPASGNRDRVMQVLEQNQGKRFVQRILDPTSVAPLQNEDGTVSTHSMAWSTNDQGNFVYPTVVEQDGKLMRLEPDQAAERALQTGEYITFQNPEDADWFSQSYKEAWKGQNMNINLEQAGGIVDAVGQAVSENVDPARAQAAAQDVMNTLSKHVSPEEADQLMNTVGQAVAGQLQQPAQDAPKPAQNPQQQHDAEAVQRSAEYAQAEKEMDKGFLEGAWGTAMTALDELGAAVGGGSLEFFQNAVFDGIYQLGRGIHILLGTKYGDTLPEDNQYFRWDSSEFMRDEILPALESHTMAGQFSREVVKFSLSMFTMGAAFKGAKLLQGGGKAMHTARTMAQGAGADFIGFNEHEARLANFINTFPSLETTITEYLASSEEDGYWEGRFKNAAEGLLLGPIADLAFMSLRIAKRVLGPTFRKGATEALSEVSAKAVVDEAEKVAREIEARENQPPLTHDDATAAAEAPRAGEQSSDVWSEAAKAEREAEAPESLEPSAPPGKKKAALTRAERNKLGEAKSSGLVAPDLKTSDGYLDELVSEMSESFKKGATQSFEKSEIYGKMVNMHKMNMGDNVASLYTTLLDKISPYANNMMGGTHTFKQVDADAAELAKVIGTTPKELVSTLTNYLGNVHNMDTVIYTTKQFINSMMDSLEDSLSHIKNGTNSITDEARVVQMVQDINDMTALLKGVQMSAARGTSVGRKLVREGISLQNADVLQDVVRRAGGSENVRKMAKKLAADSDPSVRAKVMQKGFDSVLGRIVGVTNEVWINAILSGARTMATNLVGTAVKTAALPSEYLVGGAIDYAAGRVGNLVERATKYDTQAAARSMRIGKNTIKGMFKGGVERGTKGTADYIALNSVLKEAAHGFWLAFKNQSSVLDAGFNTLERSTSYLRGETLGLKDDEGVGRLFTLAGNIVNLPSRVLTGTDEFFKQLTYRGNLRAQLYEDALEAKIPTDKIEQYIDENFNDWFDSYGRGTRKDALQYSRESTWTQDVQYGLGKGLQNIKADNPWVNQIIPFVRTPTNIIRDAGAHIPIAPLAHPKTWEALKSGGTKRAEFLGKQAFGGILAGAAVSLALDGRIVGGNTDFWQHRETSGVQPYSIRIGDTWVSFNRMDPYGMVLGLIADYADLSGFMTDDERTNFSGALLTAMASCFKSKTYMRGISDILEAAQDESGRKMETYLNNKVASFVPNIMNQATHLADPEMRSARSMLDKIKARVPGLSDSLPARYSGLTGKKLLYAKGFGEGFMDELNPFSASEQEDDIVLNELTNFHRIGKDWRYASRSISNHELTEGQVQEWNRLMGTVVLGGKTLKQRLEMLFNSDKYDLYRDMELDDPEDMRNNFRVEAIDKIFRAYRKASKEQLLRDDDELRMAIQDEHMSRVAKRRELQMKQRQALRKERKQEAQPTQEVSALETLMNLGK